MKYLNNDGIYEMHQASIEILEKGVKVYEPNALKLLKDAGATVDKELVKFPEYLVMDMVKKAPSSFIFHARDEKNSIRLGDKRVYLDAGGQALYVMDPYTLERKTPTLEDYKNITKVFDYCDNIDASGGNVHITDVPERTFPYYALIESIRNTTKCVTCTGIGRQTCLNLIRIGKLVWGDELEKKPVMMKFINPLSPLGHIKEQVECLMVFAEHNQPCNISPEANAGMTAPVTLAGLLAQCNAEILSGITIAELVRKGAPVLYGNVSAGADMRTGAIALGSIEAGILNVCFSQIAQYYHLPTRGTAGNTNAKVPGVQAGMEKGVTLLMAALGGINYISCVGGLLDSTLVISSEQMLIDNDLCGMALRALRGVEVNDSTLALDIIEKVGPGGNFLALKHTCENFKKEMFLPEFMDRNFWDAWKKNGKKTASDKAKEKVQKVLKEHKVEPLDKDIDRQLDDMLKKG